MLDLKLQTCVHGKLRDAGGFASLIVFALEPVAEAGETTRASSSMTISLDFERETPQEHDVFEVLRTGEDRSLTAEVHANKRGISWSTQSLNKRSRFGVLIRRSFDDLFFGTFRLALADSPSRYFRSPAFSERRDEAEPILFDPSAKATGDDIDLDDLQASSTQLLACLSAAPLQIDGADPSGEFSASTTGQASSQNSTSNQHDLTTPATNGHSALSQDQGKPKSSMMYHHKQRHVHNPHATTKARARSSSGHNMEMQPLHSTETDEEVWTEPTRYITTHEMGFNMFGLRITRSGVRCIRSIKLKLIQTNDSGETEEYEAAGHWSMLGMMIHKKQYHNEAKGVSQDRYLVVGRMSTNGYVIKEKIFRYREHDEEQMLRRLHKAIRAVRGTRGLFSLKSVSGFGLYQCDPSAGHHKRALLTSSQRDSLRSFYNSYRWRTSDAPEYLWNDWTFRHLNNNSKNPSEGKYSIEILLSWSVLRLSIVTSIPVALSLAVGFWYQTRKGEGDPTGTAWIIATYIITAGALIIAFLGVATGLEQA